MSTTALSGLLEYLYGTLSPNNMRWVGEHLIEYANQEEASLKPYTMDEIHDMLNEAEANYVAGRGIPDENAWDDLDEELRHSEREMAEAI